MRWTSSWENKMASICLVFKWSGYPVFKWHLKTSPKTGSIGILPLSDHLNTKLARYSDLHCMMHVLTWTGLLNKRQEVSPLSSLCLFKRVLSKNFEGWPKITKIIKKWRKKVLQNGWMNFLAIWIREIERVKKRTKSFLFLQNLSWVCTTELS